MTLSLYFVFTITPNQTQFYFVKSSVFNLMLNVNGDFLNQIKGQINYFASNLNQIKGKIKYFGSSLMFYQIKGFIKYLDPNGNQIKVQVKCWGLHLYQINV